MPPKTKAAGKGKAPAKRKLAEEFPPGEVLTDTGKKSWKLGAPIGKGGFGLIYLADPNSDKPVGTDARYVIKVVKQLPAPLKHLGVPRYWGSGLHERGGKRYRFMVIDRLGTDLQKKFEECGRRFPRKLVLQLGLRLLDVLEFIHEHEYVHADVKASNLLLSHGDPNQVYLVDYGLAYRYAPDGVLKEYKEDPKKCHDGTIEFTSIDAHKGVSPCRRGDLEIVSYCLLQWLCGRLPWEDRLQDPAYVRDAKIRGQENISELMSSCFSSQDKPDEIQRFLEEVKSLGYKDKPPYEKLRSILQSGLKSIQARDDGQLNFTAASVKVSTHTPVPGRVGSQWVCTESPRAAPRSRKAPGSGKAGGPGSRLVDTASQTTPGLAQRSRGRKKLSS
uniref:non-specific serine/threonine protein kinase n=1 Tax=Nothobranchius furzeri TaxID=105023 RepID=A0A8C6M285_NOTFU